MLEPKLNSPKALETDNVIRCVFACGVTDSIKA